MKMAILFHAEVTQKHIQSVLILMRHMSSENCTNCKQTHKSPTTKNLNPAPAAYERLSEEVD